MGGSRKEGEGRANMSGKYFGAWSKGHKFGEGEDAVKKKKHLLHNWSPMGTSKKDPKKISRGGKKEGGFLSGEKTPHAKGAWTLEGGGKKKLVGPRKRER